MNGWQQDKRWSDKFITQIKWILGECLIGPAPEEEDQDHNTDLIVLTMQSVRIGCRIRRNQYLLRYPNEFTIRASRPSGAKTELTKIMEGWGDYFFYGFSDKDETHLAAWFLGDLKVFRLWFYNQVVKCDSGNFPGKGKNNSDNSSGFYVYDRLMLPQNFIVKQEGFQQREAK